MTNQSPPPNQNTTQRVQAGAPAQANDMAMFRQTLQKMEPELRAALPPQIPVEKFIRITITAVQMNPELLTADRTSLIASTMKAAQDGLLCDGREAALTIFTTKVKDANGNEQWIKKVQYIPMIEGMLKKVRQSGATSNIIVEVVRENDLFDYELGDTPFIKHKPAMKNRGNIIGAYSIVKLITDEMSREWMDIEQIEAIRARSKSSEKGPWKSDYSEMCRKTVFRRHYKKLPKSTDIEEHLEKVIQHDNETFNPVTGEVYDTATPPAQPQQQPVAALTHQPEQAMPMMQAQAQQAEPVTVQQGVDVLPLEPQQQRAATPSLAERMQQGAAQTFQGDDKL